MQKLTRILHFDTVYCFQYTVYLYMLHYPVIYSLAERESGNKCARNCVYLSKIENSSYHQELVSHPMPEHIEALS